MMRPMMMMGVCGVLAAAGAAMASGPVVSMPTASGQVTAGQGVILPGGRGQSAPLKSPPAMSESSRRRIDAERAARESSWRPIVDVVEPGTTPITPREAGVPTAVGRPADDGGEVGTAAPGDFRVWRNTSLRNSATSNIPNSEQSTTNEPSLGVSRGAVFYTGNWYASVSPNAGITWQYINPYDNFPADGVNDVPANSGGFCCDQIVNYDDDTDMTLWYLQYNTNAAGVNVVRTVVYSSTADAVANNWTFYQWSATNFGYPANSFWLDFPDIAISENYAYFTSNVFAAGSGSTTRAVIWRCLLSELDAGGTVNYQYFTTTDRPGLRVAQSCGTTAYFAAHNTTSNIRIYRWADGAGNIFWDDVGHATYNTGTMTATGPDGRNFAGRADTRILYAARGAGDLVFGWNVTQGSGFTYPYFVFKRFRESDRALLNEYSVFNGSFAFLYGGGSSNVAGNYGGMISYGGGTEHPGLLAWLADQYNSRSFQPLENAFIRQGTSGPASNRWGDYLTARRHWYNQNTYGGAGFVLTGPNNGDTDPRFAWFGREIYQAGGDVQASAVSVTSSFQQGCAISIPWTIRNLGATTIGPVTLDFRASLNDLLSTGDVPLGTTTVASIAPGATVTGTFAGSVPTSITAGSYFIGFFTTATGDVLGTNNQIVRRPAIALANVADLAVNSLTVNALGTYYQNQLIPYTLNVGNEGVANTGIWTFQIRSSTNTIISTGDPLLQQSVGQSALGVGLTRNVIGNARVPIAFARTNPGLQYIGVIVSNPFDNGCTDNNDGFFATRVTIRYCTGDWDDDGSLDINDFFAYLSDYASGVSRADIIAPAGVDIGDFFEYLRLYGTGCPR